MDPQLDGQLTFNKGRKKYPMEKKTDSSINDLGKIGQLQVEE